MTKNIQLNYIDFDKNEYLEIKSVIQSKHLERGDTTKFVEDKISKLTQSKYSILVSSATGGLIASLKACGVGMGDEVITTPFSFAATANAIYLVGATPVYSDINVDTFNIDANKIKDRITKRTKAIVTVDLYGNPCDYEEITKLAKKHGLKVIADSSQSFGSTYKNKMHYPGVDIQVFSFFSSKSLSSGEGGVCISNNRSLIEKINLYISHGQKRGSQYKYRYVANGYNFRPTDLQAAVIKSQLNKFNKILSRHHSNAQYLNEKLKGIKGIEIPTITKSAVHSYSKYTIKISKKFGHSRKKFIDFLKKKGIESDVIYPKPLYFYKILSFGFKKGDCPIVEKVANEVLSIPIHQNLTKIDLGHIVKSIQILAAKSN